MMYAGTSHNSQYGAGPPPEIRMTDYLAEAIEFANDVLRTEITLATKWRDARPLAWLLSAIEFHIDDVHDTDLDGRTEACLREREMIQDIPQDQRASGNPLDQSIVLDLGLRAIDRSFYKYVQYFEPQVGAPANLHQVVYTFCRRLVFPAEPHAFGPSRDPPAVQETKVHVGYYPIG
ncbi:unnamed protein product [Vitrella brassicaformis CCMP3155]|uniref:Uncharacterized protein n=1 Tax=Vitrella brassicaformis (strain CCMP3155) TaxID=1169540 RepID=A0A0G4H5P0_VITBC|nr:unnamed protein product [Vitrella brassicaformis CCMP3155]|eukprot:CEM39148.1 unnamed protein product [Vitrella brassicaformis CCMP3155]